MRTGRKGRLVCDQCGEFIDGAAYVSGDTILHRSCRASMAEEAHVAEFPHSCPVCKGRGSVLHATKTKRIYRDEPDRDAWGTGSGMKTVPEDVPVAIPCPAKCNRGRVADKPRPVRATVGYVIGSQRFMGGKDYLARMDDVREEAAS